MAARDFFGTCTRKKKKERRVSVAGTEVGAVKACMEAEFEQLVKDCEEQEKQEKKLEQR